MSDVFAAISDPTRRQILELLREQRSELSAGEIAERFPRISRPAVSKHLRVLRRARLCRVRRAGRCRYYVLEGRPLRDVDHWVERYREFWQSRLERLKRYVEEGRPE